jgi:hypothetical protein
MAQQLRDDLDRGGLLSGNGKRLPARFVWERFGITSRTLDRWLADEELKFPRPLVINNRRYFDEIQLISWERARASRAA